MIQKVVAGEQAAYEILQGALDASELGASNRHVLWSAYFHLLTSMTTYQEPVCR